MMPLSPDVIPAAPAPDLAPQPQVWQPSELAVAVGIGLPLRPRTDGTTTLFEVSPTAGIPEAVLAPARLAAESAGYVEGWTRGSAAAHAAAEAEGITLRAAAAHNADLGRAEVTRAATALHEAARRLEQTTVPAVGELEGLILSAAYQIAEAVVGVSVAEDPNRGRTAVQRILALAPSEAEITIRLHPVDIAVLASTSADLGASVNLVADPALAPGDAVATTGATAIDGRIGAALERVRRQIMHGGSA